MLRYIAHFFQRTDAETIRGYLDSTYWQSIDVHQVRGGHHLEFHQIYQRGSSGYKLSILTEIRGSFLNARRNLISKGSHGYPPDFIRCAAILIASTMFG